MQYDAATRGRWIAMTTFSPLRRRNAFLSRKLWPLVRWLNRRNLFLPKRLIRLSMIGFARWSLIYPPKRKLGVLERLRPRTPYILFETNYNGSNDQYLETFSYVTPAGLRRMWGGTYGLPNVTRVSRFIDFVNSRKQPIYGYTCAYPGASTKTVRTALEVTRLHDELKRTAKCLSPTGFLAEYQKFLVAARQQNPAIPPRYEKNPHDQGTLTVIAPYETDRHKNLMSHLDRLPAAWAPAGAHFVRFTPVEEVPLPPGYESWRRLPSCLILSAWFDGDRDEFIGGLYQQEKIWRHCEGWDGGSPDDFKDYLLKYGYGDEYKARMPFAAYPGVPLGDIEAALDLTERVWQFAVANQENTTTAHAGQLKDAWHASFGA